ncbi:hypothetical protein GA0070563_11134 [Micromonospora carbonacea]|uniref:Uncharacterized protein n=1 Tax=Micromonospora carbonacea TaxID=47853 RepID=A0A1C5A2V0_9ACTN|nr:hypothetical protein GA0070563_11134 [Micromonospora carbonacea]
MAKRPVPVVLVIDLRRYAEALKDPRRPKAEG